MCIPPFADPRYRWLYMEQARLALLEQAAQEPDPFPVGWDERDALV